MYKKKNNKHHHFQQNMTKFNDSFKIKKTINHKFQMENREDSFPNRFSCLHMLPSK